MFDEEISRELVKRVKTRCRESWDAEQTEKTVYASSSASKDEKRIERKASRSRAKQARKQRNDQWRYMLDGKVAQWSVPDFLANLCGEAEGSEEGNQGKRN